MQQTRFEGKVAVDSGAGTGMGRAAALRLAQIGAKIVLLGRRLVPLELVATKIAQLGGFTIGGPRL